MILATQAINKILIIQWSAMGDCVIASGVFDDLRTAFPTAAIHLNVLPPWDKLFEHDPRIDQLINFPIRKKGLSASLKWLRVLKKERYDLILDFQGNDRTQILLTLAKLLRLTKACIIGRRPKFCYDRTPKKNLVNIHVFERFLEMLRLAGISPQGTTPKLIPSQAHNDHVTAVKVQYALIEKKYAVFIPGCSPQGHTKLWPQDYFIEFAQKLLTEDFDHILLIGAQNEHHLCQTIAATDERIINLCCQTELLEIGLWCRDAALIIGNDTGASHIAAATNRPQIALFGPTDPIKSRPYGPNVRVLSARDSPYKISPQPTAMSNLTPSYVWDQYNVFFNSVNHSNNMPNKV